MFLTKCRFQIGEGNYLGRLLKKTQSSVNARSTSRITPKSPQPPRTSLKSSEFSVLLAETIEPSAQHDAKAKHAMNERGGMEIASVRIGGERTADRKAVSDCIA